MHRLYRFPFHAMGSPCELQLYSPSPSRAQLMAHAAIAEIARLEQRYSRYNPNSILADINRAAQQGHGIEVDAETASLLNYADTCYQQSDGLFDITAGVLRRAWNFKSHQLPHADQIAPLLNQVGWYKVAWKAPHLRFQPGMELDFGGIVKEYAADRLATFCWNQGLHHGFVNLGGDIRIIGPAPDGQPWRIGIKHPRKATECLCTIELTQGGIASSGDYERCIQIQGRRYGHILNPKTGWPVEHLAAVTVVADWCVVAGSASTIALLKQDQGAAWLQELGVPHCWVGADGRTGGPLLDGST